MRQRAVLVVCRNDWRGKQRERKLSQCDPTKKLEPRGKQHSLLCDAMICNTMLCCAMLCCAMRGCAALCYATI
eukprot:1520375-Pyramimonas_sp.AAC.1